MKKIVSILLTLAVAVSLLAVPAMVSAAEPVTIVLGGDVATLVHAEGTDEQVHMGAGCWKAISGDATAAGKMELYIDPTSFPYNSLGSFTIDEIESISYWTNKPGAQGDPDFYLAIYTVGDDEGWYGYRLNAEPLYSNNLTAPANQWNQWNTDLVDNQLTFFDSNRTVAGFYNGPTLADLQAGSIDWGSYPASGSVEVIDYSNETVKYITFQTGTTWCGTFEGYIDEIIINLTTGESLTIDLEKDVGSVNLGAELEEITAISVTPSVIDFGTITPGTPQDGDPLTVENIGTVKVSVSANLDPTGGVFKYLYLNGDNRPGGSWSAGQLGMVDILPSLSRECTTELQVPATYSAKGEELATLIFEATAV